MLEKVAELLRQAERVLFVTGAGVSADSGLPTYRGVGGLYDVEMTEEGFSIEEALSGPVFHRAPEVTWKYLAQIESGCRGARPNRAHDVLAALERSLPFVMIYTQNVDGLHRDAGSTRVVEIHGSLRHLYCLRCGCERVLRDFSGLAMPPRCDECGGLIRPRVVLFGENLPVAELRRVEEAMEGGFDLVFSIGTSSRFPYVVAPILWARAQGVPTVEINPGHTDLSDVVDFPLKMRAADAMDRLARLL
jgi:NAD-dependent deacetylase